MEQYSCMARLPRARRIQCLERLTYREYYHALFVISLMEFKTIQKILTTKFGSPTWKFTTKLYTIYSKIRQLRQLVS